jgi:hypothetical protein
VLLHDRKELDDDLGGRTDKNLTLSTLLGVVDVVQSIVEDGDTDHVAKAVLKVMPNQESR